MIYDAIVVGGGIAGLTAAAFIAKAGKSVLVCEKQNHCGGLINSFERDGFVYDGGIRALENSGVLFPMLRRLGISLDWLPNRISIGIEDQTIKIVSEESVDDYLSLLQNLYPDHATDIDNIFDQIRLVMHYMDVQYSIDNPLFLDFKEDREYLIREILPWMFKYAVTAPKIARMNIPVVAFLRRYTENQSLLDIISQHFFRQTPAFFALSYLKLYLEYQYPRGGTMAFIDAVVKFIEDHHGVIQTGMEVTDLDPADKWVKDANGNVFYYGKLVWAADQQYLYRTVKTDRLESQKARNLIAERKAILADKIGNDSILTVYAATSLDRDYFSDKSTEHFFYTPSREGQSAAGTLPLGKNRDEIESWLKAFLALTTYEISIPVLRDKKLAPAGKSGLIISILFDYELTRQIQEQGWYEDFKQLCENMIIKVLSETVYPHLDQSVEEVFSSTPVTMAARTNNHQGAITGWSFLNDPIPAESRIPRIANAIKTPIPDVYQAGQWTYSPSGLPISLLTGKLAADRVVKELK